MDSIHKTLLDIEKEESFDKLDKFKEMSHWSKMGENERDLFATLLLKQGQKQLSQGSYQAVDNLDLATKISDTAQTHFFKGVIYAACRDNMRCLQWAHQAFTQALQKNPSFFEALFTDALVLNDMGDFDSDASFIMMSLQQFEKAGTLLASQTKVLAEYFYWDWGICHASLGKISGEPVDFQNAITKFQIVEERGFNDPTFLNDYGNALADIAALIDQPDYFFAALQRFSAAVDVDPNEFDGWYNRACCHLRLLETRFDLDMVEEAEMSFERAAEINSNHPQVWFRWAQLSSLHGKYKHDLELIELSLDKFFMANQLDPNHPQILSCWAQVELFLGIQRERLDLMQSARAKMLKCLEINSEIPENWYFYGSCLNELGRYFNDAAYYQQAIEKFQYGISLEQQNALLWYGLALSHFALGEIKEDRAMFEKAVRFCGKVIEHGGSGFPQFWNDWGVALMKLAEITEQPKYLELAIQKFELSLNLPLESLNVEEVDLEWVYNYGCAFDMLGELTGEPTHFEKSIKILYQVVELEPDYHQARYNLALAFANLGEAAYDLDYYEKSLEHFQVLINNDPEDEIIQMDLGVTLINMALLIHDDHHPEKSQALFRQAETHLLQAASLGNSQAYYQLAGLYSLTDRFQNAMHFIERTQFFGALPPIVDLLHDEWLEGLRHTPSFRQFLNTIAGKSKEETK